MSNIVPIDQLRVMATSVVKSGFFGGIKNPEQAMTLLLISQAENTHPMQSVMAYDIIQGRPALKSTEILSRFQKSGGSVKYIKSDDTVCEAEFTHPQGGSITVKWDLERAKKAGFGNKDNYKKFPAQMFRSRCVSEGVRAIYPSCLNSMYSVEEAQDIIEVQEVEQQEEVEIIEDNTQELKLKLANKLKNLDYDINLQRAFFNEYGADLEKLVNDDEYFNKCINSFEGE